MSTKLPPSSPEVVARTRQAILSLQHKGYLGLLATRLMSLPIWATTAAQLLLTYLRGPTTFWPAAPDAQAASLPLTEPFPVHHEYLTVNGVR